MGGPRSDRCRRSATRSPRRWREACTPAGTASSMPSARTSTTSGMARTLRSRATPSSSTRSGSRCFTRLQAGARTEQRAIPAKGLTGPGYDGHSFWDTETFVLPVLTYTAAARRGRRAALAPPHPRPRTRSRGATAASTAPRSRGERSAGRSARATGPPAPRRSTSTPTSPTRWSATSSSTDDEQFEREYGLELLVETARLWRSLGHHDAAGALSHRRRDRPGRVQRRSPTTTSTRT